MQYHASFRTADGAYHCPVGSIMAIFCLDIHSLKLNVSVCLLGKSKKRRLALSPCVHLGPQVFFVMGMYGRMGFIQPQRREGPLGLEIEGPAVVALNVVDAYGLLFMLQFPTQTLPPPHLLLKKKRKDRIYKILQTKLLERQDQRDIDMDTIGLRGLPISTLYKSKLVKCSKSSKSNHTQATTTWKRRNTKRACAVHPSHQQKMPNITRPYLGP